MYEFHPALGTDMEFFYLSELGRPSVSAPVLKWALLDSASQAVDLLLLRAKQGGKTPKDSPAPLNICVRGYGRTFCPCSNTLIVILLTEK